MKQQSKLLKVISIIMIIFGAIGTLGTFASAFLVQTLLQNPEIQTAYAAVGGPQISTAYYILTIFVAIMEVVAGITGLMYRSKKSVLFVGIIWIALLLVNLIWGVVITGFQITIILSLIFPVLYFWGWYQSN